MSEASHSPTSRMSFRPDKHPFLHAWKISRSIARHFASFFVDLFFFSTSGWFVLYSPLWLSWTPPFQGVPICFGDSLWRWSTYACIIGDAFRSLSIFFHESIDACLLRACIWTESNHAFPAICCDEMPAARCRDTPVTRLHMSERRNFCAHASSLVQLPKRPLNYEKS